MDLDASPSGRPGLTPRKIPFALTPALSPGTAAAAAEDVPRGVSPRILLTQVRNTAPFLLGKTPAGMSGLEVLSPPFRYLAVLRAMAHRLETEEAPEVSHEAYFELCLSAHWATVSSFVPTDVDNQIRFRLWSPRLPTETLLKMAEIVSESYAWDCRPVSTRWVALAGEPYGINAHFGEWFSTAAGAYGALRLRAPREAAEMKAHIEHEVCRESRSLESFARARDGISLSKAATLIAHNLGDLDRVIDMWNLPADDPLRLAVYKAGTPEGPGRWPALLKGGRLNTALMADENHRHFSLRGPKCLRRDASLLLPLGPFFDEWGLSLTRHRELSEDEVAEVAEALVDGWEWLQKGRKGEPGSPFGYPRALAGIAEGFPGGVSRLQACLPKRIARTLKAGPLHSAASIPRARFEAQWAHRALKLFSA